MKAGEVIIDIQSALGLPAEDQAPRIGPKTRALFERLAVTPKDEEWTPEAVSVVTSDRDINTAGLELVKHFESLFLDAYKDSGGVWTIGWGHTGLQHRDGTVRAGRTITREEAESLLRYDMNQFEARVSAIITAPLNDDQFSALVSFDFNTGGLTLSGGRLSTISKKLNALDYEGAAREFPKWNKDNGRVLRGLVRRRASERNLFESKHPAIVQA